MITSIDSTTTVDDYLFTSFSPSLCGPYSSFTPATWVLLASINSRCRQVASEPQNHARKENLLCCLTWPYIPLLNEPGNMPSFDLTTIHRML